MRDRSGIVTCPDCLQKRLVKQFSKSIGRCRKCAAKATNARTGSASKAGIVGGRRNADLGNLSLISKTAAHSVSAEAKRFETLKRKGLLKTSKPEKRLHELLVAKFGNDDVIHDVIVEGFRIDFYVKSKLTYVQLDGVYWHGLSAPYEEIKGYTKRQI